VAGGEAVKGVSADSIRRAIEIAEWLKREAERIYAELGEPPESDADRERRTLVSWVQRRGGSATVRDLTCGLRRFRGHGDGAKEALQELGADGLGEWVDSVSPKGGAPTRRFCLTSAIGVSAINTPSNDVENVGIDDDDDPPANYYDDMADSWEAEA
jgi:hypothetical protein